MGIKEGVKGVGEGCTFRPTRAAWMWTDARAPDGRGERSRDEPPGEGSSGNDRRHGRGNDDPDGRGTCRAGEEGGVGRGDGGIDKSRRWRDVDVTGRDNRDGKRRVGMDEGRVKASERDDRQININERTRSRLNESPVTVRAHERRLTVANALQWRENQ